MTRCGFGKQLSELSKHDRKEVRNFQRFLKLRVKWEKEMYKRPFWQKYLGIYEGKSK